MDEYAGKKAVLTGATQDMGLAIVYLVGEARCRYSLREEHTFDR